jgi:hypothetical protein
MSSKPSFVRSFGCLGLVALVSILSSAACGDDFQPCDESKCAPGNKCLALGSDVRCRKTCTSNTDPAQSCPFGFLCKDPLNGSPAFCVQSKATLPNGQPISQKPNGQWGAPCQANLGIENAACDTQQGFFCYGLSPTDAAAYCTRYDCTRDDECGPGFWCGKINITPNVTTAKSSTFGQVQNVCLRRTYCAPCAVDLDCPTSEGKKQHCIADELGIPFCTTECSGAGTCHKDAKCVDAGIGVNVCFPRASTCVGDGSLCSPCRTDADCGADGICVKGDLTEEKLCAKQVNSCTACPRTVPSPARRAIGCLEEATDTIPVNYCFGVYNVAGTPTGVGCWTADR